MLAAVRPAARAGVRAFSTTPRSADMARISLIGRLGKVDPKTSKAGKPYVRYAVATSDYMSKEAREADPNARPTTSWHTIFAHGDAGERVASIPIGSTVYVEANYEWRQGQNDAGENTYTMLATHSNIKVIQRKREEGEGSNQN
ncbi:single-strand binding protein [Rhodotorula toruloides]|uniref:Single-strand binding protein n=1 Tax=Rhodotorula toruloides TaxID=5286 RepID=A0A511KEN2_RHOTO|nr:single-strand binding protein [Rhodotorula toruloides]